jgi:hypothetical protein
MSSLPRGEQRLDIAVIGNVALESAGARQVGDEPLGLELHALVLVADGQGRAALVELLGDAPRNGAFIGQSEYHRCFARQIDHFSSSPPGFALHAGTIESVPKFPRGLKPFCTSWRWRQDESRLV